MRFPSPAALGVAVVIAGSGFAMAASPQHKVSMPFDGLATYDDFAVQDDDMSELLLLLSQTQTPLLNLLAQAPRAATGILHEWTSERIGPDRIYASTAVNSATANTGFQTDGMAHLLQVGMILEMESSIQPAGGPEQVRIESIPGPNSLLVSRNFAAGGVNSLVAGGTFFVVSSAELEGDDTNGDVSRPRDQFQNFTQIFKKPIKMSGSRQAVATLPNVGSEFDHQETLRSIELLRDLEKAIIRSRSTNTIGSDSVVRTMKGLRSLLTTNNSLIKHNSFTAAPMDYVNDHLQASWTNGARDVNVILVGKDWSKAISGTNASRVQISQSERSREQVVEQIVTDFGVVTKVMSPWMPNRSFMTLATGRIFAMPLTGRNFQRQALAKTGDSDKAQIIGEYTLELHGEYQMSQANEDITS